MKLDDRYRIIPEGLISNEAIVKMIVDSKSQEELDVQLTLLGASSLDSRELTEAIKNRTYPVGSYILMCYQHEDKTASENRYINKLIPFKIFEYRDNETTFCQSIACLRHNTAFSENSSNDYLTSDIRKFMQSSTFRSRFSKDFLDNHLKTSSWEVENSNGTEIIKFEDDFVLPSHREIMNFCELGKDRIRIFFK